jgi:hypothetical protein
VSRRGDPDGRGRAVLKVYRTRVCSTIEVRGIEPATTTTTVPQTSTVRTYQSTRLPGIKRLELTGGCVEVPRALTEELRDHPRRFYVNVHNNPYPEGAIRGQLHRRDDDGRRHDERGRQDRDGRRHDDEPTTAPVQQPQQAVVEPAPITLSGSGPAATRLFRLEAGLTVIRMTHQGTSNFIVDFLDTNGNSVAFGSVANVIDPFQGSTPVQIPRGADYLLDVQADGPWQIVVEQPRAASAPQTRSFSGDSQQATQLFALSAGLHRVHMTHQGDSNFIVDLLDENGESVTLGLANEIGPFDGSRAVQVPVDGIYLFSVQANGPWTINID